MIKQYLSDIKKIPNIISIFRILLLIPIFFLLGDLEKNRIYVISIILIAFLSDLTDGYLARKLNQITELGKLMDPLGDKMFVAVLATKLFLEGEINQFYFFTVLARDLLIFTGGVILQRKIHKILPSNLLGKIAAFSIGCYILSIIFGFPADSIILEFFYYASLILSFLSVIGYAIRAYESIKWYSKNESA